VRACQDVRPRFGGAPSRHHGGSLLSPDAPPGLLPVAPSRAADPARLKRRRTLSTGWQQAVDNIPFPRLHGRGSSPPGPLVDEALARTSTLSKMVAGSSMEGTSGAADLDLLRGRACDAALDPGCVRASDASAPWRFVRAARLCAGELGRWPRASGSPRVCELLPFAGVGLVGWDRLSAFPERVQRLATSESPVDGATISRREVSERIGLG
jgi:hypothetical protein